MGGVSLDTLRVQEPHRQRVVCVCVCVCVCGGGGGGGGEEERATCNIAKTTEQVSMQ